MRCVQIFRAIGGELFDPCRRFAAPQLIDYGASVDDDQGACPTRLRAPPEPPARAPPRWAFPRSGRAAGFALGFRRVWVDAQSGGAPAGSARTSRSLPSP